MTENQLNIPEEIWKEIPGFPGYKASNLGRIWSAGNKRGNVLPRILQSVKIRRNYFAHLHINGKGHTLKIARLVLLAFVGPCPEGMECCHYNDKGEDNHLTNLRWDTHNSNTADSIRNGVKRGTKNGRAKLSESQIEEIKSLHKAGHLQRNIAKQFNISKGSVSNIVLGKSWKHL